MLRRVVVPAAAVLLVLVIGGFVQLGHVSPPAAFSFSLDPRAVATPTPSVSNDPSPAGGLGNARDDLERVYGSPTGLQGTMIGYRDGKVAATYTDDRATAILLNYADAPRPLDSARASVKALLPSDSTFVGTMNAGPLRIADVYRSKRLGAKVGSPADGSPRGQFVVVYETDPTGAVKDVLLAVGGVPPSQ